MLETKKKKKTKQNGKGPKNLQKIGIFKGGHPKMEKSEKIDF